MVDSEKIQQIAGGDHAKSLAAELAPMATQSPYKQPMTTFLRTDADFDMLGAIEPLLI